MSSTLWKTTRLHVLHEKVLYAELMWIVEKYDIFDAFLQLLSFY